MTYLLTFCLKIELWINVTVDCGQEIQKIYKEWEKVTNTIAFIRNREKLRIVGHSDVYFKFWANLIFFSYFHACTPTIINIILRRMMWLPKMLTFLSKFTRPKCNTQIVWQPNELKMNTNEQKIFI